jgi:phosphatidylglycerol---prolipoprotein diacylglyceryl transferase
MYPVLFKIGPFSIYSFGLMMGLGFLTASYILTKELRRKELDANLGNTITLLALIFGIAGSKLLFLAENWEEFVREPMNAFSPGGLTWYGGLILATAVIYFYTRRKDLPFLKICDAAAPALMLGYGVARIGCHLAGDGDYGVPTNLPWATVYAKGTYPPSVAFRDFPEIVQKYGVNGVVPDTIPVHPAPVYEFILSVLLFILLWKLRKNDYVDGKIFMIYLLVSGMSRFLVEFIRINPRILFGLSEAQLIACLMMALGALGIAFLAQQRAKQTVAAQ